MWSAELSSYLNCFQYFAELVHNNRVFERKQISRLGEILLLQDLLEQFVHFECNLYDYKIVMFIWKRNQKRKINLYTSMQ